MTGRSPPPLLGISPGDGRDLPGWIRAVSAGGLGGVLLREPAIGARALRGAVELARERDLFVAVHERCPQGQSLAEQTGTLLHLASGRVKEQRRSRDRGQPFAVSAHTQDEVDEALEAGAVYALLSPVWSPSSKPGDQRPPLGLEAFLAVASRHAPLQVLALGGVTPERYRALRAKGAGAAILGPLALPEPALTETLRLYLGPQAR